MSSSATVVVMEEENVQIAHCVLVQVKSVELAVRGNRMGSLVLM